MKRLLLLTLTLGIFTYSWAYDFKSGDLYYNITSNSAPYTVEVTYSSTSIPSSDDDVNYANLITANIPASVSYSGKTYSVTGIGGFAFSMCSSLTSITIQNGITSIGYSAFYKCTALVSINIPEGITNIRNQTFCYCTSLTTINIPATVTSIGTFAFAWCSSLTSITIPDNVRGIGKSAFVCCSSLESVTIGKSVNTIGENAFQRCASLKSIIIPNEVTIIEGGTFQGCTSLHYVSIGKNVTSIGHNAFYECSSLTSVTIPNNVIEIGYYAFLNCQSLQSLIIGKNVTTIGEGAFADCSSLGSVIIPSSVTTIERHVFIGCSSLISIVVENGNTVYDSRNNCNAIIETSTNTLISGCNYTFIPEDVITIGEAAFCRCITLVNTITIPKNVKKIETSAFLRTSLSSVYVKAETPPTLGTNTFLESSPVCYIPCGTLTAYQKSDWKNYMSRFIEECIDLLVIPYEATSLSHEERKSNPNHIIYPATLEDKDSVEMRCN